MKKWGKIITFLLVLSCVAGISVWRIVSLNQEFADWQSDKVYEAGQTVTYQNLEINADRLWIGTQEEAIQYFELDPGELYLDDMPSKLVFTKLHIKNLSDEIRKVSLVDFSIASGDLLSNGIRLDYFLEMNEQTTSPELAPGNEIEVWVGTSFLQSMFRNSEDWENLQNKQFHLVIALSPMKISLNLN